VSLVACRSATVIGVVLLTGCAYFNGLYNANRLAGEARKAEREGRAAEARSLWAGAAVKAESVAVRYPDSRYRDDALLLWGDALRQSGTCREALHPYAVATDSSTDESLRAQAAVGRAECFLELGAADSAVAVLAPYPTDSTGELASDVAYWRGRAALQAGDPASAARDLGQSRHSDAPFPLSLALLALGDAVQARATLESRVLGPFEESQWRSTLNAVGRDAPEVASAVLERLIDRPGLTAGQWARLLVDDGDRWARVGFPDSAAKRYAEAVQVAPDSADGQLGEVRLALESMRQTDDLAVVRGTQERLEEAAQAGGVAAEAASEPLRLLRLTSAAAERGDAPLGDVLRFTAAELLRDSLGAPALAAQMFYLIGREHPSSVLAPKALLAAASIDSENADSVYRVLLREYSASPYTLAISGQMTERYAVVEDSVRVLMDRARSILERPERRRP